MIEAYFEDMLQQLLISPAIFVFKVLREIISEEDGYIRVKCYLLNGDVLEFSEYVQTHTNRIHLIAYSYHWQASDGGLVKRWDNVPHHKEFDSFPHHLHLPHGEVRSSAAINFRKVILDIEEAMAIPENGY